MGVGIHDWFAHGLCCDCVEPSLGPKRDVVAVGVFGAVAVRYAHAVVLDIQCHGQVAWGVSTDSRETPDCFLRLRLRVGDDRVLVENPENADINGDSVSLSSTGGLPTNNSDVSPSTFPSGSPTAAPSKSEVVIRNNVPTGLPTMPQGNISYNS